MSTETRDGCATLDYALGYRAGGISIIPIKSDGSKKPRYSWKEYESVIADEATVRQWWGNGLVSGIAAIGGVVSGGLEAVDVDEPELVEPYIAAVEALQPGLVAAITRHQTPRPGLHLAYRCDVVEGNQTLAQTEPMPEFDKATGDPVIDEKTGKQKLTKKTLIETRGEGGYILVPGCPAKCHPTGRLYEHVSGPKLADAVRITPEEREVLFAAARQFNRFVDDADDEKSTPNNPRQSGLQPGDDYNQRVSWHDILIPHGWEPVKSFGSQTHWRRPGKDDGTSATTGNTSKNGNDLLCVFSTNAYPFEGANVRSKCTSYTKFAAFATLNHGGDFKAATKALAAAGYGESNLLAGEQNSAVPGENRANSLSLRFADNRTERANARRFLSTHGGNVRWCEPWESWAAFNGRHWETDERRLIESWAKDEAAKLWTEVGEIHRTEDTPDTIKQAVTAFAKSSNSANGIRNMLALAKSDVPILPKELDAQPWLLNVENGTLDLRNGKLLPHNRSDMLTKLAPVVYDPEATCPTWLAFLDRIMAGNNALISFLQRAVGMSLSGVVRDHVLMFAYGTGANGKSVFLNTIKRMLGDDYGLNAPPELLLVKQQSGAHPTEMASLFGKRFVCAIELDDGRRFAESTIKSMTGSDPITTRRMYENFWTFEPQHHIWVAGNHRPTVRGNDWGIWRRIRLIPFAVTIPPDQQDAELSEKLLDELSGVLNWALVGCQDWQDVGLHEPSEVMVATKEYRAAMDTIGEYIDERCKLGNSLTIKASDLYGDFKAWAADSGEYVPSQRHFGLKLTERGIERFTNNGTHYRGIDLTSRLNY